MYYKVELNQIPKITNYYSVTRNTVWQICDKDNILIIINDGMCEISCDSERFIAKMGDIVFIPANHSYCRRSIDNTMCKMTYIHFSMGVDAEQIEWEDLSLEIIKQKKIVDDEMISQTQITPYLHNIYIQNHNYGFSIDKLSAILEDIKLFSTNREITCFLQSSISLCRILIHMTNYTLSHISENIKLENTVSVPYNLKKVIAYIRRHYTRPITLNELADCCNVSKQHITRYFKNTFGDTPINYVIKYKISKSKELIFNNPHLTITEISYELGFNDQHYFSRIFKKITGETPSHYKYRVHHFRQE